MKNINEILQIIEHVILIILSVFSVILYANVIYANQSNLSKESLDLKKKYEIMKDNPGNYEHEVSYLKAFPSNLDSFSKIFYPNDFSKELYSNYHAYIPKVGDLLKNHRILAGTIIINLTKDGAPSCCDPWTDLHGLAVKFALEYTNDFIAMINEQSPHESKNIINFIADVENHYVFNEYSLIIENIKKLGYNDLSNKFEEARNKRMLIKDH